jgi:hypothetical protein
MMKETDMPTNRLAPASMVLHTAAELCAAIETGTDPLQNRWLNAIASGARELVAGVMPSIQGDAWRYGSRSRPGQVAHSVTRSTDADGYPTLACTCEAGGPDDACWHRGHRRLLEALRPVAATPFPPQSAQEEADELFAPRAITTNWR